jgi:hypothetical protein
MWTQAEEDDYRFSNGLVHLEFESAVAHSEALRLVNTQESVPQ